MNDSENNCCNEKTDEMPTFSLSTIRRYQSNSQHRTLLSSSNQSNKCRSQLEKEFRSQKVLFTTPSAVSLPPIKLMSNLGLDDSLHCYKSSPMANLQPNLSPIKEKMDSAPQKLTSNSSSSSENKIDEQLKSIPHSSHNNEQNNKQIEMIEQKPNDKKVIHINGKDFIIHNRIGQGGSSCVFLAEHKDTKLECALKVKC